MTDVLRPNSKILPLLVPFAIIIFLVLLARTQLFEGNPSAFSLAITFDLLLTVPVVYFFLIRKKKVPKITVVPVFVLGTIIAGVILPKDQQFYLDLAKSWLLPLIELTVVTIVLVNVRKTIRFFRKESAIEPDFYCALKKACRKVLPPKVDSVFAMEISVFYYSLFAWRKRKLAPNEFTYHRDSTILILLSVFIFVILMETSVVHLLLQGWSVIVAWILTGLSIYTALQLFAIIRSLTRRPIAISDRTLFLKYGLFAETEIPFEKIESVALSSKPIEFDNSTRHLSPFKDADSYNVVLELKEEHEMCGFYGMKKSFSKIVFHVDEKERFLDSLTKRARVLLNSTDD